MASDSQQIDPSDLGDDSIPERMERGASDVDLDATTAGTISVEVDDDLGEEEDAPLPLRQSVDNDDEMDITPMIDITFLLLIFFLVASKMDSEQAVKLPRAQGAAVASKNSVVVIVRADGTDSVLVQRRDGTDFPEENEEMITAIVEYVEAGLREGKEQVILKAEKGIKHKEVARVAKAIGRATTTDELPVKTIFIAVKGINEPP